MYLDVISYDYRLPPAATPATSCVLTYQRLQRFSAGGGWNMQTVRQCKSTGFCNTHERGFVGLFLCEIYMTEI